MVPAAEVGETPGVTLGVATILGVILDEVVSSTASVSLSETVINVPEGAAQAEIGETMVEAAPGTGARRQIGLAADRHICSSTAGRSAWRSRTAPRD